MRALRFNRTGELGNLKVKNIPIPSPKEGELLVKVVASGINPIDIKGVMGMLPITTVPRTPGRDFAGIIVSGERMGQPVLGSGGRLGVTQDGSHAEYVVVPEKGVIAKPQEMSFELASTLGVPWRTAWCAIEKEGKLQKDEMVLITGVTGAVGKIAAQIAKKKGARVFGTVRKNPARVNKQFVDVVIDLEKMELSDAIKQITGGKGVDMVLDTVAGPLFKPALRSLKVGGRQIAISSPPTEVPFDLLDFYRRELKLIGINTLRSSMEECAEMLKEILVFLKDEPLDTSIETCSLELAPEVYKNIAERQLTGKYAILF